MGVLTSTLFKNATKKAADDASVSKATKATPEWLSVKDVNKRLEQCAASDPSHITPTPKAKGPHVAMIHQALEAIAKGTTTPVPPLGVPSSPADREARTFNEVIKAVKANPIAAGEREKAEYGPSTAKAILAYKTARDIRRGSLPVDNVVGILTIQSLDRDVNTASGTPPKPSDDKDKDKTKKFLDVILAISVTPHRKEINTVPQLVTFVRSRVASAEYSGKADRELKVIAFFADQPGGIDVNSEFIKLSNLAGGQSLGKVMGYGVSFGGKRVTQIVKSIPGSIPLEFIGVADGAFFDEDTQNRPEGSVSGISRVGTPKNIPKMSGAFSLPRGRGMSVFQTKGNLLKIINPLGSGNDDNKLTGWFSFMANGEIHGDVPGYDPRNVNDRCTATDHLDLHIQAATIGEDIILSEMQKILRTVS